MKEQNLELVAKLKAQESQKTIERISLFVTVCFNITAVCIVSRLFDISNTEPSAIGLAVFIAVVMIVFDVAYLAFGVNGNCLEDLLNNTLLGGDDER